MHAAILLFLLLWHYSMAFCELSYHRMSVAREARAKPALMDDIFRPFHGHGSGERHIPEMIEEEKALQKYRMLRYSGKRLHDKYSPENWFDQIFNHPFHGHGSGENSLDEMFKAQQRILYERREYFGNKGMLRKKYSAYEKDHLRDIKATHENPALQNKREDDAMWIAESIRKRLTT